MFIQRWEKQLFNVVAGEIEKTKHPFASIKVISIIISQLGTGDDLSLSEMTKMNLGIRLLVEKLPNEGDRINKTDCVQVWFDTSSVRRNLFKASGTRYGVRISNARDICANEVLLQI